MAKEVTTLFIEDTGIKLMTAQGKRVLKWARAPLEPGLVTNDAVINQEEVVDRLKNLFIQLGASTKKVTVGLSGINSVYRLISLPELPAAVLPEAVRREAARTIPTPLDTVYYSYQAVPSTEKGSLVFLAAYPRKETDALVRVLRSADIEADTMDLCPLAVCRTLNEPKAIIVSARPASLDIIVMVDGVPQVIRNLPRHRETETLAETVGATGDEIKRTITFYNSSHGGAPLDTSVPVFVSGDLFEKPELWPALLGTLNNPVSALLSPMEHSAGFPVNDFIVNVGLALKNVPLEKQGHYYSLVNFNALPKAYIPKKTNVFRLVPTIGAGVGIVGLILLALFVLNMANDTIALRSGMANIQTDIARNTNKADSSKEQILQLNGQIQPLAGTMNNLQSTLSSLGSTRTHDYGALFAMTGAGKNPIVNLESIDYSDGQATIRGRAGSVSDILDYVVMLRSSGLFSKVVIPSITYVPEKTGVLTEVVISPYILPEYATVVNEVEAGNVSGRMKLTEQVETAAAHYQFSLTLQ